MGASPLPPATRSIGASAGRSQKSPAALNAHVTAHEVEVVHEAR
jgi:hypothetical protein